MQVVRPLPLRKGKGIQVPLHTTPWHHQPLAASYAGGVAYVDDRYVPIADASVSILDRGLGRSSTCRDTISVWDGMFFRLEDHLSRFERSWRSLRLQCPMTRDELRDVLLKLVAIGGWRDATVQLVMTRGISNFGSHDTGQGRNRLLAFAMPYVWLVSPENQKSGISVYVDDKTRMLFSLLDASSSSNRRLDFDMWLFEAYDQAADTVLLTNDEGLVTEGPGFNVFAVVDGQLLTPKSSIVEGMTRRTVLELAQERGWRASQVDIDLATLKNADEIFLTTTAGGIIPVTRVNGHQISSRPGAMTTRVHSEYWERRTEGWLSTPGLYW